MDMRTLYVLVAVALAVALLSGFGAYTVYLELAQLNSRIEVLSDKLTGLEEKFGNLADSLKELAEKTSTAVTVTKTSQNLTAPELVYEMVKDSVVMVRVTVLVETLFGPSYTSAEGSGFIYDEDGHIITNYHVVEGARKIEVYFLDKTIVEGRLVGTDPYSDLAVIEINPSGRILKPLHLGNSSELKVGQPVIAVGSPFGLSGSLTTGVISQLGRVLRAPGGRLIPNVIQFDAAVNPGNSGGPLLDYSGRVIGVTTAIASTTGAFSGIGFAIPSNIVSKVVKAIITVGEYKHPWLGIAGVDVNPEIAEAVGLPKAYGFLVTNVAENGPAAKAGIRGGTKTVKLSDGRVIKIGGDVILGVNGVRIIGLADLLAYLEEYTNPGDIITLTVFRDGEVVDVKAQLGALP